MKICVPVVDKNEFQSKVSEHFGSAPFFVIVDTKSKDCSFIKNTNQHHSHGMCQPLSVLGNYEYDGIIVSGIGMGALNKLNAAGKKVMKSTAQDLNGILEAYSKGDLIEVDTKNACHSHTCK